MTFATLMGDTPPLEVSASFGTISEYFFLTMRVLHNPYELQTISLKALSFASLAIEGATALRSRTYSGWAHGRGPARDGAQAVMDGA